MGRKIGKIVIVLGAIFFLNGLGLRAEEKAEIYRIYCEEPNGQNGYYIKPVKIEIEHMDQEYITKLQMDFPDGKALTGELEKPGDKIVLEEKLFEQGTYQLTVWMENKDGKVMAGTKQNREMKIDKKAPEKPILFKYSKNNSGEQISSNEEITVEMTASDDISGIQGIYYQLDGETYEYQKGECIKITVPIGFIGEVSAYAVDGAGNKGKPVRSKKLICEEQEPEILIHTSEGFEKWYNKLCQIQIEVSEGTISSGIKEIVCSVNDIIVQKKTFEQGEKNKEKVLLSVDTLSELVVEVTDWAGNSVKKRKKILFDNEKPKIRLERIENYIIMGKNQPITCSVTDNQRVASVDGTIIWYDVRGQRIERKVENWEKDGKKYFMTENIETTGKYEMHLEAVDQAGNRSEESLWFIMDKENPIIQQIEELQGKYMPFFKWNYEVSEIVKDFTVYTYRINIDGRICEQNKRYTQEGKHSLELIAEDSAGNTSKREVEFIIDHTPPEIQIDCSKERKTLDIRLEEKADILEAVFINGKRLDNGNQKNEFSHVFEKTGSYDILVLAKDLAGNQSEKKVIFEVEKEKSFFQNLFQSKKEKTKEKTSEEKKESHKVEIWGILIALGVGVVVGIKYRKAS